MADPEIYRRIERLGLPRYIQKHHTQDRARLTGEVFEILAYDWMVSDFPPPRYLVVTPSQVHELQKRITQSDYAVWHLSYPDGFILETIGRQSYVLRKVLEYKVPRVSLYDKYHHQSDGQQNLISFLRRHNNEGDDITALFSSTLGTSIHHLQIPRHIPTHYLIPQGTSVEGISDTLSGASSLDYEKLPITREEIHTLVNRYRCSPSSPNISVTPRGFEPRLTG